MNLRRILAALALLTVSTGCVAWTTPPATSISSTPPGARVVVDGKSSGFLTPCLVKLDTGRDHRLRLELAGHVPQELLLSEAGDLYLIPWRRGYDAPYGWAFPLFLGARDLFAPVRIDNGLSPDRVHVSLEPVGSVQ